MILAGALTLTACGGDDDDASDEAATEPAAEEPAAEAPGDGGDGGLAIGGDTGDVSEGDSGSGGGPSIDLGQVGRDVIIEMRVTVSTDDIKRSVSAVSARAAALGGGVASSDVDYGARVDDPAADGTSDDTSGGYAVLVVKVPPAAVDDLIAGIERTGTIRSINQSAQDVTEQLVDLDVRIANARASVENVRAFMERAEDLSDLVTLESELTRRQTELEQLEAQQRNLSERVAFATLTVEIIPTAAVPEPPDGDDSIGDALRRGWDGFTATIWGVGYVLAVLLPFLAAAAVVGLAALVIRRRRHRDPSGSASGPPEPERAT